MLQLEKSIIELLILNHQLQLNTEYIVILYPQPWITFSTDSPEESVIDNLIKYEAYEIRVTNSCGSYTSIVYVQELGTRNPDKNKASRLSNYDSPCDGASYTNDIQYYEGGGNYIGATFEWVNEAGTVVSTSQNFTVSSWNSSLNGVYTLKVIYAGCDEISTKYEISSKYCGSTYATLICTKAPATGTVGVTNMGISTQQTQNSGWPQNIPNGFIALESKEKGFVITRVQSSSLIAEPKEGMIIYDINDACVELYDGTEWGCLRRNCNETLIIPN